MEYEIDLQTKKKGVELTSMWEEILRSISRKVETIPTELRSVQNDERMDQWCNEIAKRLGLLYYRNGKWLCFCDKAMGLN